jgi:hypothetical protein
MLSPIAPSASTPADADAVKNTFTATTTLIVFIMTAPLPVNPKTTLENLRAIRQILLGFQY